MPLIDGIRPDPADDAGTLSLSDWAKERGFDPATRTYTPTAVVRALPGAHPGTHRPDDDAA